MALKQAAAMDDLKSRLVRTTIDRIKDFTLHADGGCGVVNGLVPKITGATTPSVFTYSGGDAYVAGTKFTVVSGSYTKTNDAVANRYFWVDGAGAVQHGTAWPGTAHCKLWRMYGSTTAAAIYRIEMGMGDRDSLEGIDLSRRRVVVQPAANVSTLAALESYPGVGAAHSPVGYGYGVYFVPKRPFLFMGMQLNHSVAQTGRTIRHGLKSAAAPTAWLAYREQTVTWGTGAFNWVLASPVMVMPGTTYLWGWQAYDNNANLGVYQPSPYNPDEGAYIGLCWDLGSAGAYRFYGPDTTAVNSTWSIGANSRQCVTALLGYNATFGRFRLKPAALAALPGRALAGVGARRMNAGTGAFNPLAASQYLKYQVSLDNGAHWQDVVIGNELVMTYGGTDLILDATIVNDHADEAHITDVGFFYEG